MYPQCSYTMLIKIKEKLKKKRNKELRIHRQKEKKNHLVTGFLPETHILT
jgi:hypothetical protein